MEGHDIIIIIIIIIIITTAREKEYGNKNTKNSGKLSSQDIFLV
jgi:hypothetical protein